MCCKCGLDLAPAMNLDLESSDQSDQEPPTDSSTKNNSQKTGGENEARNGQ